MWLRSIQCAPIYNESQILISTNFNLTAHVMQRCINDGIYQRSFGEKIANYDILFKFGSFFLQTHKKMVSVTCGINRSSAKSNSNEILHCFFNHKTLPWLSPRKKWPMRRKYCAFTAIVSRLTASCILFTDFINSAVAGLFFPRTPHFSFCHVIIIFLVRF